ncbi:MAG: TIGR03087 family PEP-CTERM/XrtA system glycosyltransferase [Alphaproteobacteria bacterium]|nr:TIGR03087 family PEP-CTERM/XrtA system glycosyltransferase [Alphaproteobacteria bacterium]
MTPLLFLAHRIPYPPNKGDKIRSWNILRYLAERYSVHLGCFIDDEEDRAHTGVLQELCESCHFAPLDARAARLRGLPGLLRGDPITLGYYRDRGLARWVRETVSRAAIGHVFAFSSAMAQYALDGPAAAARRVIDFVDVDSDKWRQYAAAKRWPESRIYGREARTLLGFERRVAAAFDVSLFVSEAEAALFRSLAPESADRIAALKNGVDVDYFDPSRAYPNPFDGPGPALVFTGAMDYWANVDAVDWFARDVLPAIRAVHADAAFHIVGAKPAQQVRALSALPGVQVTGRVADVRPFVAHAAISVAPLRLARGVQNKVLEAMAMARPVLATPEALEGIDAVPGQEVFRASGADGLSRAALEMLARNDLASVGAAARDCVVSGYGWSACLNGLNKFLDDGALR